MKHLSMLWLSIDTNHSYINVDNSAFCKSGNRIQEPTQ